MEIVYIMLSVFGAFFTLLIIAIVVMGRMNRMDSDPPTSTWKDHAEQQIRRERIEKMKLLDMDLWKD